MPKRKTLAGFFTPVNSKKSRKLEIGGEPEVAPLPRRPLADFLARIPADWRAALEPTFAESWWQDLATSIDDVTAESVFHPLEVCPLDSVKVVLFDGWTRPVVAGGLPLAFSTARPHPPSVPLQFMYRKLSRETGGVFRPPDHGDLTPWATQGVLLLHAQIPKITVIAPGVVDLPTRRVEAGDGFNAYWPLFIRCVLAAVAAAHDHIVYMLWGPPTTAPTGPFTVSHLILNVGPPIIDDGLGHDVSRPRFVMRGDKVVKRRTPPPRDCNLFESAPGFAAVNDYLVAQGRTRVDWTDL